MKRAINKKTVLIILVLLSGFASIGQVKSSDKFKVTQITREINDIKVIVSQSKSLIESPGIPHCKADIKIIKNDNPFDSIEFPDIEAVGGHYGLLVYKELVNGHLIISKYGDYDGETIIINGKGQKFETIGGYSYVDSSSWLLFSIYYSDLAGFSIFDLKDDRELVALGDLENRPMEFFKTTGNRYFFRAINDETEKETTWEIDIVKKKIKQVEPDLNENKTAILPQLTDYKVLDVNCE
jgi:hypothetical protein